MTIMNIPKRWEWSTFGELTENLDGRRVPIKAKDRATMQGPYAYYGASGIIDSVDGYLFDGDYLLITEDGNLLSKSHPIAFIARGKFWVNNHAHVVKSVGDVPMGYLQHFANGMELHSYITGTTRPKLTQAALNRIPVPLAPLPEQRRIVAEIEKQFTRLDASVAALRRTQANLKRYRASTLRAACSGELAPTEAELARAEGREYEPADVLLERILAERRAHWESQEKRRGKYKEPAAPDTSDLPTLPEGWAWATVDQLILGTPQNGLYKPKDQYGDGMPILRITDYQDFEIKDRHNLNRLKVSEEEASTYGLNVNDILVNRVNSLSHLGKCLAIPHSILPAVFESNMMRLVVADEILPVFVSCYLRSFPGRKRLISRAKWAVNQASINQFDVCITPIPLPPLAEQRRIVAEVERRLSVIKQAEAAVEASLQRAERLRQSILKRAFTGRAGSPGPGRRAGVGPAGTHPRRTRGGAGGIGYQEASDPAATHQNSGATS